MREDWERVARVVATRRRSLGLSQDDVAEASGGTISKPVLSLVENARQSSYKPRTLAGLERALRWRPGSIDRILAGLDPEPVEPPMLESDLARKLLAEMERLRATVEQLAAELHTQDHRSR